MGCCVSTDKPPSSPRLHQNSSKSSSRAPPPVEEETVKEVLSETPNPKHFLKIEDEPRKTTPKKSYDMIRKPLDHNAKDINVFEEVSEICSTKSESLSTTTLEDDEVYHRRVIDRSPAKFRNRQPVSGEFREVGKSPVRGKQQSPGRVGSVPGRDGPGNGFGSAGRQRPVSAPRSRSPANRQAMGGNGVARNGIGRSPSARKTGRSPGRVGSDLHDRIRKPEMNRGREREEESSWPPTATNNDESLENPLVSLECFIFL